MKELFQKEYWENVEIHRKYRKPEHPVTRYFVMPKIELIRKYINLGKNTRMLDVGSGFGTFGFYFDKIMDTCCLDYSYYKISKNKCRKRVQADANSLPFKDSSFDVVFCGGLLHHVENPAAVVGEMKRVSRKSIVLFEPNRNNPLMLLYSLLDRSERGGLNFSKGYMVGLVKRKGMKVRKIRSMGWIFQNRSPLLMARIMQYFENWPLAAYNILIAEK